MPAWFYRHSDIQKGPVSRQDLQQALKRGEIDSGALVWREGLAGWETLREVEELQPPLDSMPPPPPPPGPPPPPEPLPKPGPPPKPSFVTSGLQLFRLPGKFATWYLRNLLWSRLFGRHARIGGIAFFAVVLCLVLMGFFFWRNRLPATPLVAKGHVLIDANPWGQVEWIRGPHGKKIRLPDSRTTPYLMALPTGQYQAQVTYPYGSVTKSCDFQVAKNQRTECQLDLEPVDAEIYLKALGW